MRFRIPFTQVLIDLEKMFADLLPNFLLPDSIHPRTLPEDLIDNPKPKLSFAKSPPVQPALPSMTAFEEMILDPEAVMRRREEANRIAMDEALTADRQMRLIDESKANARAEQMQTLPESVDHSPSWYIRTTAIQHNISIQGAMKMYFDRGLCCECGAPAKAIHFDKCRGLVCASCNAHTMESRDGRISILRDRVDPSRDPIEESMSNRDKFAKGICSICGGDMKWCRDSTTTKTCQKCGRTIEAVYRGKRHFTMKVLNEGSFKRVTRDLFEVVEERLGAGVLPKGQLNAPMPKVSPPKPSVMDDPMYKNAWGNMF